MRHEPDRDVSTDEVEEPPFKPLTREEAQALRAQWSSPSPWRIVMIQAAFGLAIAVLGFTVWREAAVGWSALYGAATVVVPGGLLAHGMAGRAADAGPGAAMFRFMVWELAKVLVAIAMLVAAPIVVPTLSWPALLVAMVMCMKVSWWALLRQGQVKRNNG